MKNLGERSVGHPNRVKGGGVPRQNDMIFNYLQAFCFFLKLCRFVCYRHIIPIMLQLVKY